MRSATASAVSGVCQDDRRAKSYCSPSGVLPEVRRRHLRMEHAHNDVVFGELLARRRARARFSAYFVEA